MRLGCVRLSAKGLPVPQIAGLLEVHQATVREALHRFGAGGLDALADAPRTGRPPRASGEDLDVLEEMLDASATPGLTWTLPAIAKWLERTRGVHLSSSWISVLLHKDGFRYKRTRDHLRHKADVALQHAAAEQLAGLRQGAGAGRIELYYLEEAGFTPTLPTGYTWARTGMRALVPRQDKRNRRIDVLGALAGEGPKPHLGWASMPTKIDAGVLLEFVCARIAGLPGGAVGLAAPPPGWQRVRPCVIVLDNASAHVAPAFKDHRGELAALGVELFYLPAYSPQLNKIERLWRSVKYEDMPIRAYASIDELKTAVDAAMIRRAAGLQRSAPNLLKAA
jgi:transposase